MNCKEYLDNEIFSDLVSKLESRGYIIDELDNISRVLIEKLSGCFNELSKNYNIKTNLIPKNINTHAIECNGEWIYIVWNNQKFNFEKAKKIIKEFCLKKIKGNNDK